VRLTALTSATRCGHCTRPAADPDGPAQPASEAVEMGTMVGIWEIFFAWS
jgi:hypothetical protein